MIENVVWEIPHEKQSFTNVYIVWSWDQSNKTSFSSSTDLIMTSQVPTPKYDWGKVFFESLTHMEQLLAVEPFLRKKSQKIWNCDLSFLFEVISQHVVLVYKLVGALTALAYLQSYHEWKVILCKISGALN